MNLKEMKEMLQLMAEHGLTEIEIEKDGLKIKLKKGAFGKIINEEMNEEFSRTSFGGASEKPVALQEITKPSADNPNIYIVKSPMVGTFYSAPSPDQPAYVTGGKKVKEGDVLCIVEAMKLMNEIKSEISGTVTEVFVKNGQPLEFDQPLFKIQKG